MSDDSPRYRAMQAAQAYHRLATHPEARAEAIAHHYVSHAQAAVHLLTLVKARRRCSPEELVTIDSVIAHGIAAIADSHHTDLGLELAWPTPPSTWGDGSDDISMGGPPMPHD